ncbi:MAG: Tn3 family transposase [Pseudomonadota bacterium]
MTKSERLNILSEIEEFAFYGLPDFDDEQRATYFTFTREEIDLICRCREFNAQVYCAIQIGYFKAKKMFFKFSLSRIQKEDIHFILTRYFENKELSEFNVTKHEYRFQQNEILNLFGYALWTKANLPLVKKYAEDIAKRDATPKFILQEVFHFLKEQKIVRPGYTTLQTVVGEALVSERLRIKVCLQTYLTDDHKRLLQILINNDETLALLAALKQDAKNFNFMQMNVEIKKNQLLKSLYPISKMIIPHLSLSQHNINYYASLVHRYTIRDLKRFDDEKTYLYLLCYVFRRYQQINDNIMTSLIVNTKRFEIDIKANVKEQANNDRDDRDQQVAKLMLIFVDDKLSDTTTFDIPRKQAFAILPKELIKALANKMLKKKVQEHERQWKERDKASARYKYNLRPLFMNLKFESRLEENPLLKAIEWMQDVFSKKQALTKQKTEEIPIDFISNSTKKYIQVNNDKDETTYLMNRYELQVYRQLIEQIDTGVIHIKDSIRYRPFSEDLVSLERKEEALKTLDIPWLKTPCVDQIDLLFKELDTLWNTFDVRLKQGSLKHIKYNPVKEEITWIKPKKNREAQQESLYSKLPMRDLSEVLRFVDHQTNFMSAFSPLQPRYVKQKYDVDHLIAVLMSNASNIGHYKMAKISDIPYHKLESTYQQYMRLLTLREANVIIANKIAQLPIFPHYTFDEDTLFGSLDGQKFEALTPTAKARNSKKYFKKGRGVVAYTFLSNHVPLMNELIGAHDHESYFSFDLWYGNTSIIQPMVVTSDMHGINKANFALFHWFGGDFRPRFANLKSELKKVCGANDTSTYNSFWLKPTKAIDKQLILDEKENIDHIIATLSLKEISQSVLIQKLCALPQNNATLNAVFEYDKLIRSIYTLKCILDPTILENVQRSQNRIESYHGLRAAIAKVTGRKALLGQTDLEMEISNECGRLIANAIIYYNASIQSSLLERSPKSKKMLKFLKKSSPVAWCHIHFTGHFVFYSDKESIDIEDIIENVLIE